MNQHPNESDTFTDSARRGWDSVATGWKKWAPTIEQAAQVINDRLVDMAGIQSGHKVLDIATGYGEPLVTVLERVGPNGHVVATDLSSEMIELARKRVADANVTNAVFHACNAETLEIPESNFDAALCRWGLMLMGDPDACLDRTRQLLKPGGCVAMAVFSEPPRTPWLSLAGSTVRRELDIGPPTPEEPNIFRLADSEELEQRFGAAGFVDIALDRVASECVYDSPEDYVEFLKDCARDISRLLEYESAERQEEIWQAVADAARHYQDDGGGVRLGLECHCIAARKRA